MSPARQVLVLADDLTGANDTAVQFARLGWGAYLALADSRQTRSDGPMVIARSLDSRAEEADRAAALTESAVSDSSQAGHLYLKIDSTMRGSVAGQVAGAVRGRRSSDPEAFVVLCPAYPAMGRTVRAGQVLVSGEPAHLGPAGQDPITPLRTSALTELVPGSVRVPTAEDARSLAGAIERAAMTSTCVVVDAETDADLDRLAEAIGIIGDRALPAGSAGLALALAARWRSASDVDEPPTEPGRHPRADGQPTPRHTVVVVSSQHRMALEQVAATLAELPESLITLSVPTSEDVADAEAARPCRRQLVAGQATRIRLVVAPPIGGTSDDSVATGRSVATALASVVSDLVDAGPEGLDLVLVGGDGAAAVLGRLGAEALRVTGALVEGVPLAAIVGGPHAGLRVATKAGGFGDVTTLTQILSQLDPDLVGATP